MSAASPEQYLSDLIAVGLESGKLTDSDAAAVRSACLSLLAQNAETLLGAESGSVRIETATDLLTSISFVIGTALHAYPTENDAITALRTVSTAQLYADGQRRIRQKLQTARLLHYRLRQHLFVTPNVFYRATVIDAIGGFFKLYHPELFAHERHITADYPTFFGLPPLFGIAFIEQYQKDIAYENRFCRSFAPSCVDTLLRKQQPRYAQTVMNLFSPVLTAALGCVLTAVAGDDLISAFRSGPCNQRSQYAVLCHAFHRALHSLIVQHLERMLLEREQLLDGNLLHLLPFLFLPGFFGGKHLIETFQRQVCVAFRHRPAPPSSKIDTKSNGQG